MLEDDRYAHVYMQCMKNQSSNLGTYTIDGCGEFVPHNEGPYCSACGCHRSFHLKVSPARNIFHLPPPLQENQAAETQRRSRTRFTTEQKEKMGIFAEKIGWKIQGKRERDEDGEVEKFLKESGVSRRAFKVWMHNHRNSNAQTQNTADSSSTDKTDYTNIPVAAESNSVVPKETESVALKNLQYFILFSLLMFLLGPLPKLGIHLRKKDA